MAVQSLARSCRLFFSFFSPVARQRKNNPRRLLYIIESRWGGCFALFVPRVLAPIIMMSTRQRLSVLRERYVYTECIRLQQGHSSVWYDMNHEVNESRRPWNGSVSSSAVAKMRRNNQRALSLSLCVCFSALDSTFFFCLYYSFSRCLAGKAQREKMLNSGSFNIHITRVVASYIVPFALV